MSTRLHGRTYKFVHKYARKNMKIRESPLLTVKAPKGAVLFLFVFFTFLIEKLAKAVLIMVV